MHDPTSSPRPALLGGTKVFEEPVYVMRALAPDRALLHQKLDEIVERRWYTNDGPVVRELEAALHARLGAGFCLAFANGTVALQAALRALDLEGAVVTTPFTFPATVHAIEWNGLEPVFCDIDPDTWNLDPNALEACLDDRACALLPVHVFGNPCDVEALATIAERRGLRIVYDAAHAFGVSLHDRPIGAFGDLSVFSFHATKAFHTAEGGAVAGADADLRHRLALLRNFGIVDEDHVDGVGVNGKLSELHAALGLAVLEAAEAERRAREHLLARYREGVAGLCGVKLQRFASGYGSNAYNFAIEIDPAEFGLTRDQVHIAMAAENVISRKYFHPLCSENASYRSLPSAASERLPNATRVASRVLCLPLYGELGDAGVDGVLDALRRIQAHAPSIRRVAAETSR